MEPSPGEIGALYSILIRHWGAVERDLLTNGFRFADVNTERLTFDEFTNFVIYAPPGTAVYHQLHQGWTVGDHLAAFQLDVLNWLRWAKTEDGQHNKNPPDPTPRPGVTTTAADDLNGMSEFTVSVQDYLRMVAEWEERQD